jgi:tripartite-type tricarboxylate transporter receptor subunit TctC
VLRKNLIQALYSAFIRSEGGFPHITIELLRVMAGFTYVHVPYKGSAQVGTDLIGGHVDAASDGIIGLAPHVRSGNLYRKR